MRTSTSVGRTLQNLKQLGKFLASRGPRRRSRDEGLKA
jgi:hypothetical protein